MQVWINVWINTLVTVENWELHFDLEQVSFEPRNVRFVLLGYNDALAHYEKSNLELKQNRTVKAV